MITPKFQGKAKDGRLQLLRRDLFEKHLHSLDGCDIDVTVTKHKKDRSSKQNRYYNGVVLKILGDELGNDREEMHEIVRMKFLQDFSGRFPRLKSTARLSTVEMEAFLSEVRQWASRDLNIFIPLPHDVEWD